VALPGLKLGDTVYSPVALVDVPPPVYVGVVVVQVGLAQLTVTVAPAMKLPVEDLTTPEIVDEAAAK